GARRSLLFPPDREVDDRAEQPDEDDQQAPYQLAVAADASLGAEQVSQREHDQGDLDDQNRQDQQQDLASGHRSSLHFSADRSQHSGWFAAAAFRPAYARQHTPGDRASRPPE